jgi:hypothetical protein
MKEGDPLPTCSNDWFFVDELDPALMQICKAGLDIVDLEADVVYPWPTLAKIAGDSAIVGGGFHEFDFNISDREKGNNRFLIRHILDMGYFQLECIPPKVQGGLDILHDDGNMIDAFYRGHPVSLYSSICVFYVMSHLRINLQPSARPTSRLRRRLAG